MAFEHLHGGFTFPAGSDLSALQYRFVSITGGEAVVVSGAGILVDAVLQNNPIALGEAELTPLNGSISKVVAGAAISINADVMNDAAGKAVTATSAKEIVGKALEAAGADNEIISVLILRRGVVP